ncbi:MAG: VOC family protein [Acidimicrobiales bacterium]|nr:VOC family protein [Acidimicrobiales bacterium]
MIATLRLAALDCPDAPALAAFYGEITGWPIADDSDGDWFELAAPEGVTLAFQEVADHQPPAWPSGVPPQQAHLDFAVGSLDEAEIQVLALGAVKADVQPEPDQWRVYIDPAGHPFCFVLAAAD